MDFTITAFTVAVLAVVGSYGQVDIHKADSDGYIRIPHANDTGNSEIYTSMYQLTKFFQEERAYVEDIKTILEKKLVSQGATSGLGSYVASYDDVIGAQDEDDTFLHNPVNVYNLIRHVAVGWAMVEQTLQEEKKHKKGQMPKRVRKVLARRKKAHVPGAEDLDGVAIGITRLHDYYKFDMERFVQEGVIETDEYVAESNGDLTVWDAFKIGVKGANNLILGSGLEIMLHALEKAKTDGVTVPPFVDALDMKVLKNLIKTAKTVHDQKLDRWGPRTAQHSVNPVPYDKRLAKKKKFQNPKTPQWRLQDNKIPGTPLEKDQYIELCRGNDLRNESVLKDLYCKYDDKNNPWFRYGPLKVEVVSLDPHVAVVHEFILNKEADEIMEAASPKLRRSEIVGLNYNGTHDDYRVSEQTWLWEDKTSTAALTNRIKEYLNLNALSTRDAELYQVANYGLAGQYDVHYDQVMMFNDPASNLQKREVFNRASGDRITTLMGYLSDVEAGGYTVFPIIGAYVKPRKGSLVVWWNMDKAGGYDYRTRHGGCPVMVGSKWITNKWVRSNSQMFNRPCPKYTNRQLRDFRKDKYRKGGLFYEP